MHHRQRRLGVKDRLQAVFLIPLHLVRAVAPLRAADDDVRLAAAVRVELRHALDVDVRQEDLPRLPERALVHALREVVDVAVLRWDRHPLAVRRAAAPVVIKRICTHSLSLERRRRIESALGYACQKMLGGVPFVVSNCEA